MASGLPSFLLYLVAIVLVSLLALPRSNARTVTWVGSTGNWTEDSNWDPPEIPGRTGAFLQQEGAPTHT